MKRSGILGLLCFVVHLILEITSFYIVASYTKSEAIWVLALIYDFLAFVPQGFFGYLRDRGVRLNFALLGVVLTTAALLMMYSGLNAFSVVLVLSVGNCMVHIHCAEATLRGSAGEIAPSAVFVSGGSFGVIAGKLLAQFGFPLLYVLLINLFSIIPIILFSLFKNHEIEENLYKYDFADKSVNASAVILLSVFVVAVRSFMGSEIPTAWNNTVLRTVLLFSFMGIGKALGGILTDRLGIRKTALISVVGALPFLLLGNNFMAVSLFGIMLFSMTMAVSLALIVSVIPNYPGAAFGFTTVGLFIGSLPVFFFKLDSVIINCIIITALSVVCILILNHICKKESGKNAKDA